MPKLKVIGYLNTHHFLFTGAYYCLNMVMITLSTFLSVIVVNLYFHGARQEVPRIVRKVSVLARKITHHECEGGIEKSIPRDHRLPLLVKLRNADW